jgi:opacity protein-like surface antigen
MFRKTSLLVGVLAMLVVAPQVHAAAKGDMSIYFMGGASIPMGDYGDFAKLGFGGGVGFDYFVNENIAVGVDGSYTMNDAKDDVNAALTALATAPVKASDSFIRGGAHGKWMFPTAAESKISPYLIAGAGIYNVKAKLESADPLFNGDASESKFGGHGGLGVLFKTGGNVGVGAQGTYHFISTSGSSTQFVELQAVVSVGMGASK